MKPPIDQQVSWVYTEDLDATCRFYAEVLGLEQVLDEGPARVFRAAGDAFVGVCEVFGDRSTQTSGTMLTFVTDEVDAWHRRLVAAGARIREAPARNDKFNIYAFLAEDPNGYAIEFQQFLDAAWPRKIR